MGMTMFGREIRKLRIDRSLKLFDQAEMMDCSTAFLSAVETGRKGIPDGFVDRVRELFGLSDIEFASLKKAAELSKKSVVVQLEGKGQSTRELAVAFARSFDSLNADQIKNILEVLHNGQR